MKAQRAWLFALWKYKLHHRPESRFEHETHVAFAFRMVPIAFFPYYQDFGGYNRVASISFTSACTRLGCTSLSCCTTEQT